MKPTQAFAQSAGYKAPMHPDDMQEAAPAIERVLTREDLPYHVSGQHTADASLLRLLGNHYIGQDFIKKHGKNPKVMAQELFNRIMVDRRGLNGR